MASRRKYCFSPDQVLWKGDVPCFPDEEFSPCCGENSTCLANGLCYDAQSKRLNRGTCTDYDWDSAKCPQYCTKSTFRVD